MYFFHESDLFRDFLCHDLKKSAAAAGSIIKRGNFYSIYYLCSCHVSYLILQSLAVVAIFLFTIGDALGSEIVSLDHLFDHSTHVSRILELSSCDNVFVEYLTSNFPVLHLYL